MQKNILYVGDIYPVQDFGGSVVLYRHLKNLEQSGWDINIIVNMDKISIQKSSHIFPQSWNIISIPSRRWWWIPVRKQLELSINLRILFWEMECKQVLNEKKIDSIITVFTGYYSILASYISENWRIPLSVLVHDDMPIPQMTSTYYEKAKRIILDRASRVWFVSQELTHYFPEVPNEKMSILLPISDKANNFKFSTWQNKFQTNPTFAHAGSFYEVQVPYFEQIANTINSIGGNLLIVTDKDNPAYIELSRRCNNVILQEKFQNSNDVFEFLLNRASCMILVYPLEDNNWVKASFPSRLVEFIHLGIPYLIIAPENSALGKWSLNHNWLGYLNNINKNKHLEIIVNMTDENKWKQMAAQSVKVAMGEFNAALIQEQFESELATMEKRNY